MASYQGTYEDLEDMILRDQYFLTCDESLQTFLKEKGKMSLKDMCIYVLYVQCMKQY